jgi:hypothetical protein
MSTTYAQFLQNEAKLALASKTSNVLVQRFLQLDAIPEGNRDRIDWAEFETLTKAMRARWRASEADKKAKKLVAKIEADNRKVDVHAKILLGIAAIELARQDIQLRTKLLTLAGAMPSADNDYLAILLDEHSKKLR